MGPITLLLTTLNRFDTNYIILRNVEILQKEENFGKETKDSFGIFWNIIFMA
jgi:hypothetical protein